MRRRASRIHTHDKDFELTNLIARMTEPTQMATNLVTTDYKESPEGRRLKRLFDRVDSESGGGVSRRAHH